DRNVTGVQTCALPIYMRIGIPAEIMNRESRVAATPASVSSLVQDGYEVFFQAGAGAGANFSDEEYQQAGANVVDSAQEAWESAEIGRASCREREEMAA